jgi:hypothetical protein
MANRYNKTSELNLPIPAAEQRGITANFPAERPLVIMVLTQQSCGEFTLRD